MPEIAPFRATRYDRRIAGDVSQVTSPPYDVISADERAALEATSPYNIVRLILPQAEGAGPPGKYMRAAATLDSWLASGILHEESRESFTVYEQRYEVGGERRVQRGILAAVALDEKGILPHEGTMPATVQDRLALTRATRANLEPIFAIYDGAGAAAREAISAAVAGPPLLSFRDDAGIENVAWRLDDPEAIRAVTEGLAPATTVIADGHHRYRTSLLYRDERRGADGPGPWDAMLMYLVDAGSGGTSLLPIHRVVSGCSADEAVERLTGPFLVEPVAGDDLDRLAAEVSTLRTGGRIFAMADRKRAWLLRAADPATECAALPPDRPAAWRDLDVAVLHALVFDRLLPGAQVGFVHSPREAAEALARGDASLAFLLAPVTFQTVRAIAEARETMPSKSTYFFPKPRTGIVLRRMA